MLRPKYGEGRNFGMKPARTSAEEGNITKDSLNTVDAAL